MDRLIARSSGMYRDARESIGRAYVGESCTLDGYPATITGRLLSFACVRTLDGGRTAEYAWETVARIMGDGGAFRT